MSQPFDSCSEHFANLRPRAAEFGAIPALQLTDDPGKVASAFVALQQEADKPGLALLVLHLPDKQLRFVVELDGLQGADRSPHLTDDSRSCRREPMFLMPPRSTTRNQRARGER